MIEVHPNRQHRRGHGKSDPADAIGAAKAVQSGEARCAPKSAKGRVEAIRLLQVARRTAMKGRTQTANRIHAVVDTASDQLRAPLPGLRTEAMVAKATRFRPAGIDTPQGAAKLTLATLARRWLALTDEITTLDTHLEPLVKTTAPTLVRLNGVGAQTASSLLVAAGDNPDRLDAEASSAALCGGRANL